MAKKLNFLTEAVNAHFKTEFGKLNCIGELVMAAIAISYTATDAAKHLVFATMSTVKTFILERDINYQYTETSFFIIISPVLATFILCLILCITQEKRKESIKKAK